MFNRNARDRHTKLWNFEMEWTDIILPRKWTKYQQEKLSREGRSPIYISALTHIARFFISQFFRSRPLFIVQFLSGIHDEKCCMCEWDHWNNIGANPARYHGEFTTSKLQRIRVMCVKALNSESDRTTTCWTVKGLFDTISENFKQEQYHPIALVLQKS